MKFTALSIHSKITRHAEKQENKIHKKKRNQLIETDLVMTQMIEFHMFKKLGESLNILKRHGQYSNV